MSDDPASPQWSEMFAKCPEQPDPLPSRRIFGRRIKFIWGASRVIRGQWLLGLVGRYDRGDGRRWEGLAFSVRGMLLWGLGLGVASYFSGAAAVHAVRSRSPYNLVRYTDVLLWPVQRARMRELTGRAFLAEGLVDLRVKRYAEGIRRLRIGLHLHPEDTQARRALAQFQLRSRQRPQALQTMSDRLKVGYPGRQFLAELFSMAAAGEDHAVILDACDRYRAGGASGLPAADRPWLLQEEVQALLAAGHAVEALRLAAAAGADAPAGVKEAAVLALLDLGRAGEASEFLAAWRANAGPELARVVRLQARAFREEQRISEMDSALRTLRSLAPSDPRPAVFGVVQRAMAGRDEDAVAALGDYFRRFGGSGENLRLVAQPLAEIAALPLVQRCFDRAAALGHEVKPLRVLLFQAQMQRGDWSAAQHTLGELRPAIAADDPAERFWLEWQERLVAAAADSSPLAQSALLDVFQNRVLPLPVFCHTGAVLVRAKRAETARRVLDFGRRDYPASGSLAKLQADSSRSLAAR